MDLRPLPRFSVRQVLAALIFAGLSAAACAPQSSTTSSTATLSLPATTLATTWGFAPALATAPSIDSPAVAAIGTDTAFAAFESADTTQRLVLYVKAQRIETEITASQPHSLKLARLPAGRLLATWIDRDASGISTLYAAQVDRQGASLFGALAVSNSAVTRYNLIGMPAGGAWAVWSAVVSGEPTLVASRLDDAGRPRMPQLLQLDADYPALAVLISGDVTLFWLQGENQDLYQAQLIDTGLSEPVRRSPAPWVGQTGDLLAGLSAGVDRSHGYVVFHTLTNAGKQRALVTSGPLDQPDWGPAAPINPVMGDQPFQTGFNHGIAFTTAVSASAPEAGWIAPARGQYDIMAAAAMIETHLYVLYFRAGALVGAQEITSLPSGIIAAPSLTLDDERDLALAWWQPGPETASLYAISSR